MMRIPPLFSDGFFRRNRRKPCLRVTVRAEGFPAVRIGFSVSGVPGSGWVDKHAPPVVHIDPSAFDQAGYPPFEDIVGDGAVPA